MPFGLGFFATAGAGAGAAGSFDLLETQVLGSTAASITFASLNTYASTYQHLQIRMAGSTTSGINWVDIQFNGDTGSNYSRHELRGNGSSVTSSASANYDSYLFGIWGDAPGAAVVDLLDPFETTKFKTGRALSGWVGADGVQLTSGSWRNTNAISSIQIKNNGSAIFKIGTRFSLYGIKAA
jgi:hypothetical protein